MRRARVGQSRRRALAALAGAGVLAAVPVMVQAAGSAPGGPVERGASVIPGKETPAVVKAALKGKGPIVIAFLLPGITEDEIVQKRLNALKKERKFKDTSFIVYRITQKTKLGDLPTMFDLKYTPAIAIIQGDDRLGNVWRGLVDEDTIAQSLLDARAAVPKPVKAKVKTQGPAGNPAGIALAKKANAAYAKVPGVTMTGTFSVPGAGPVEATLTAKLSNGITQAVGGDLKVVGRPAKMYIDATGQYVMLDGAACWTRSTRVQDVDGIGEPVLEVAGTKFGKPIKKGSSWTVPVVDEHGVKVTATIDGKSHQLTELTFDSEGQKASVKVAALDKAPAITKPEKIC